MPYKPLIIILSLAALLGLSGCNDTGSSEGDDGSAPAATGTAPTAETAPQDGVPVESPAPENAAADADAGEAVAEATAAGTPPVVADEPWKAGEISLGLTIAEARKLLPVHETIPWQETWAVDNYTGVITVGTYQDPVRRVLSVICYEGVVAGVNNSLRETDSDFIAEFNHLTEVLGDSRGQTPDFAEGRQFIYKMLHSDPAPDYQYMWADDEKQYMYFAARFSEPAVSNFALIDAAVYDDAATAMEQLDTSGK